MIPNLKVFLNEKCDKNKLTTDLVKRVSPFSLRVEGVQKISKCA
jgi:hypothetical protein